MKVKPILNFSFVSLFTFAPLVAWGAESTLSGAGPAVGTAVSWGLPVAPSVWSLAPGTTPPGINDNAKIAVTGFADIRGSAAAFAPTATLGTTEIQDLNLDSTAALTINNNSTSRDMLLKLNGGRGAAFPLIQTNGNFPYVVNNGATKLLTISLGVSGDIQVPNNTLSMSAIIAEHGGSFGFSKKGAGTLTLSGANTFTGGLTLSAGILRATGNAGALGAGNLTLTGAELQLANNTALAFNRPTTVTANTQITSDTTTAVAGVVHSLGALSIGSNTLTIAKGALATGTTSGVAFSGTTLTGDATVAVGAGTLLRLGNTDVGANLLTVANVATGGPTTIAALNASVPARIAVNGVAATALTAVNLTGTSSLAISGTGATTITALNASVPATLDLTGAGVKTITAVNLTGTSNLTFSATSATGAAIGTVTGDGGLELAVNGAGIPVISGVMTIPGAGGFVKTGTGRVTISGASPLFTTGSTLNAGITEVTNNGALGTGAVVVNTGATLEINLAASTLTASSVTANAGSRVAVRNVLTNTPITLAGGNLGTRSGDAGVFAGPVNVTANSSATIISYTTPTSNQSLTIAGQLSGASNLSVLGGATANAGLKALILTNPANDFSGTFNVATAQRLSSVPSSGSGSTLGTATVSLAGSFLRLNDNGAGSNGILAYGNNLTVGTGGGTIDLDRVSGFNTGNTFALGSLEIGAGTLTVNAGNGYKGSFSGSTLTGDATINSAAPLTISGPVTGAFGLTKGGAGSLTLAGANTYTGVTNVNVGALNLTGSLAGSVAVGTAATLAGTGNIAGSTTIADTGIIVAGNAGSGTLTTNGLIFTAGATVNFTTDATPGKIQVNGSGGLVANGPAGSVALKLLSPLPSVGFHPVIEYTGAIGGTGTTAFSLAPLPNPRIAANIFDNGSAVGIQVTSVDTPRWSGQLSGEWSTATLANPKNWQLTLIPGATDYISGDNVLFDDNATGLKAVDLSVEDVSPASVVFDNTSAAPYSLGGTKSISGSTGLVKTKNGILTISNVNSFTGPVSITTGTISANTLTDSTVNGALGAGTAINLASGGTLEFTGATGSTNRPVSITSGGGVKVGAASMATFAGAIGGSGPFTLDNAGTATVTGTISALSALTVNNTGTATVSGTISGVSTLTLNNTGTATVSGPIAGMNTFTLDNSGTATISGALALATALDISGSGGTTVSSNVPATSALTKSGTGTTTMIGAANAPTSTTINGGVLKYGNATVMGSTGTTLITNNGTIAFDIPFSNPAPPTLPAALNLPVINEIVGTGTMVKIGIGNVTLQGATPNTFSGLTTVSGGNLILSKTSGINAIGGDLVVETGGTVSYGTTAGQLTDHVPDTASITINGGTFGSGAGATLAGPTAGVSDTVKNVTVNSGTFLSGRVLAATPVPFTITDNLTVLGGTALVQRGGHLVVPTVQVSGAGILNLDGGSTTATQESKLDVGTGGLSLSGSTITMNAGPSAITATSVGSIITLGGDLTSTGVSSILRFVTATITGPKAEIDLGNTTRTFNVTNSLTIGNTTAGVVIKGVGGLFKIGTGTLSLAGTNTYTGDTVVSAGVLEISGTSIADTNKLEINGGKVSITAAANETVNTLFFDGVQQLAGVYGSTSSTAVGANANDARFAGTGTLTVLTGPITDAYLAWIESPAYNTPPLSAADKLTTADPDGDGVNNLLEFTLAGNPVVASQAILPVVTADATNVYVSFKRSDESEAPATVQTVEISADLQDWTTIPAITVGATSAGNVAVTENGTAADDIVVTIPYAGTIKFARLKVVK